MSENEKANEWREVPPPPAKEPSARSRFSPETCSKLERAFLWYGEKEVVVAQVRFLAPSCCGNESDSANSFVLRNSNSTENLEKQNNGEINKQQGVWDETRREDAVSPHHVSDVRCSADFYWHQHLDNQRSESVLFTGDSVSLDDSPGDQVSSNHQVSTQAPEVMGRLSIGACPSVSKSHRWIDDSKFKPPFRPGNVNVDLRYYRAKTVCEKGISATMEMTMAGNQVTCSGIHEAISDGHLFEGLIIEARSQLQLAAFYSNIRKRLKRWGPGEGRAPVSP